MKIIKKIIFDIIIFIALNGMFLAFMTWSFSIDIGERGKENIGNSLNTLSTETMSPLFDDPKTYWNDLGSDMNLYNIAISKVDNPFVAAVELPWKTKQDVGEFGDRNGSDMVPYWNLVQAIYMPDYDNTGDNSYSRSWHLIVGIVRPLLIHFEVKQIRYILLFSVTGLMFALFYKISVELSWREALAFAVAISARVWWMQSMALTTFTDIFITEAAMMYVISNYKKKWFDKYLDVFFIVVGALTYAAGFFIAPLLTLGMPLVLLILLSNEKDNEIYSWIKIIRNSVIWVLSYGLTMVTKAKLSDILNIESRTEGLVKHYLGLDYSLKERIERILYCFKGATNPGNIKIFFLIIVLVCVLYMVIKNGFTTNDKFWRLAFVGCYPIMWIFIIAEHSKHYWVANITSISFFAFISMILLFINKKKQ